MKLTKVFGKNEVIRINAFLKTKFLFLDHRKGIIFQEDRTFSFLPDVWLKLQIINALIPEASSKNVKDWERPSTRLPGYNLH
jgi:hypothetical protein